MATSLATTEPKDIASLHGAPDDKIGDKNAESSLPQFLRLQLNKDTVEQLRKTSESGRTVEIVFGKTPTLKLGDEIKNIKISPVAFRSELYEQSVNKDGLLQFKGMLSHQMTLETAREQLRATNQAHAALSAKLNEERQRREDNQMTLLQSDSDASRKPALLRKKPNIMRPTNNRPRPSHSGQSLPSSPGLSASIMTSIKPNRSAPTSAPAGQSGLQLKTQAQKYALSHLLAVRPTSKKLLAEQTKVSEADVTQFLARHGKEATQGGQFELNERSYKDLDIWSFRYKTEEDRLSAQKNAIRALDRLRISKEDKVWQALLPPHERNKGIFLSKLNLNGTPHGSGTPSASSQLPSDHRKLLSGVGGDTVVRPRASSGSNLQRVMNGKRPVPGKASPNPALKRAASPRPVTDEKETSTEKKASVEARLDKKNSQTKKPEAREYKSAEFVNDDDELSDDNFGTDQTLIKANSPAPKSQVSERDKAKQTSKDVSRTGTKRKSENQEDLSRSGAGLVSKPSANATPRNDSKRQKTNDVPARPSASPASLPMVQKAERKITKQSALSAPEDRGQRKAGQTQPSKSIPSSDARANGDPPQPSAPVKRHVSDSSGAKSASLKPNAPSPQEQAKGPAATKRVDDGNRSQTLGQARSWANSNERHVNRLPSQTTSTIKTTNDVGPNSKPITLPSSNVKQAIQTNGPSLQKVTTNSSSSSSSSTTSSTSRTSIFSPAATPVHRKSSSTSSLASHAPPPVIKRIKASELKRPTSSQSGRGKTSASNSSSSLLTKRRKMDRDGRDDSSSPLTPTSHLAHIGTPSDYHHSSPRSPEEPNSSEKTRHRDSRVGEIGKALTPEARSRTSSGASCTKDVVDSDPKSQRATTPPNASGPTSAPASTTKGPPNDDQVTTYHTLQAKYTPLFKTSMHLSLSIGTLPADILTPSDRSRCTAALDAMMSVMRDLKSLLRCMSAPTLSAIALDSADIADKLRRDDDATTTGAPYQWIVLPTKWRLDDVPGLEPWARAKIDALKTEYMARKEAWDAGAAGRSDQVADVSEEERREYTWLYEKAILIQQWDMVLA